MIETGMGGLGKPETPDGVEGGRAEGSGGRAVSSGGIAEGSGAELWAQKRRAVGSRGATLL